MTAGVCHFGVLGPLLIELDGRAVAVSSGRQRALLAILLAADGKPVPRDRLITELWGERPPANAVAALHVYLSKLRSILGDRLASSAAGYRLVPGSFELDLHAFDHLVDQARREPAQAVALLGAALALFRGEPLSDITSDGSVAQWRRTLEDRRLDTIERHLEAQLAAGAGGELVPELERLVREHPAEPPLWGQLMLALYRAGRPADALEAYQRARRTLSSELGREPGEPLRRLQQQILGRDRALLPAVRPSRLPVSAPVPAGRGSELAALTGLLADPDLRLLTLTGPAGVGKTELLLALARAEEFRHADGAVLVRLDGVTDPARLGTMIAAELARHDSGERPTVAAGDLAGSLRPRELLLVLDGFDGLLDAAAQIADLLADAPRLRVLISSRTALQLRGEHVYALEPLSLPLPPAIA